MRCACGAHPVIGSGSRLGPSRAVPSRAQPGAARAARLVTRVSNDELGRLVSECAKAGFVATTSATSIEKAPRATARIIDLDAGAHDRIEALMRGLP